MELDAADRQALLELDAEERGALWSLVRDVDYSQKWVVGENEFLPSTMIEPRSISPKPDQRVVYSGKFVDRVCLGVAPLVQRYTYYVSKNGLYVPFSGLVEYGLGNIRDSVYFHLYARFGHEEIDRKWAKGVGRYDDDWETHFNQKDELEPSICIMLLRGTFSG